MSEVRDIPVANHAVRRWIERVNPDATFNQARREIRRMAKNGSRSSRPRRWVLGGHPSQPTGCTYIYHPDIPKTALVETGGTIVTVMVDSRERRRGTKRWRF